MPSVVLCCVCAGGAVTAQNAAEGEGGHCSSAAHQATETALRLCAFEDPEVMFRILPKGLAEGKKEVSTREEPCLQMGFPIPLVFK